MVFPSLLNTHPKRCQPLTNATKRGIVPARRVHPNAHPPAPPLPAGHQAAPPRHPPNPVQELLSSRRFERSCVSDALLCNKNCTTAMTLRAGLKRSHTNSCISGPYNVIIVPSPQLCHPTLPARGATWCTDFPAVLPLSSAARVRILPVHQFASEGFESSMFQVTNL